jgi:hypothetical protein
MVSSTNLQGESYRHLVLLNCTLLASATGSGFCLEFSVSIAEGQHRVFFAGYSNRRKKTSKMRIPWMLVDYSGIWNDTNFTTDVLNLIYAAASIILFIGIVLEINRLRRRFSASACFELAVFVFLFAAAVDPRIRLFLYDNFLAPIINALLAPLRKLFELGAGH